MAIRNLAEAIILQSIEDLWTREEKQDCVAFFEGEGFYLCSGMAGINMFHKRKLLKMIGTSMGRELICLDMQEDSVEYSFGGR